MKKIYHKIKKHPQVKKIINNKKFQKHEKWFLVVFWAAGIFYLSSSPLDEFFWGFDAWEFIIRKLAHMFVFGVLFFLIFRYLSYTEKRNLHWNLLWAFIFSVLYGISDEYHQTLVPGRHGTATDVLIDTIGILIASWLVYYEYYHQKNKKL